MPTIHSIPFFWHCVVKDVCLHAHGVKDTPCCALLVERLHHQHADNRAALAFAHACATCGLWAVGCGVIAMVPAVGKQHARVLWVGMFKVLRAAKSFAQSLAAAGSKGPDVTTDWTGAGEISEACKTFLALPGSNHDALCAMLTQTQDTLEDG